MHPHPRRRRDVGGIVDEGLKAPKKQSACLIASQSDNLRSPDTSVGMREGQSPGSIPTFGGGSELRSQRESCRKVRDLETSGGMREGLLMSGLRSKF